MDTIQLQTKHSPRSSRHAYDYLAVPHLLAMPVNRPRRLLADKGYDADSIRQELLFHGTRPVIPPRAGRKNPPACDYHAYRDRNRIERMFNRIKQFRRIATRYDKTKTSYAALLAMAAAKFGSHTFSTSYRSLSRLFRICNPKRGLMPTFIYRIEYRGHTKSVRIRKSNLRDGLAKLSKRRFQVSKLPNRVCLAR